VFKSTCSRLTAISIVCLALLLGLIGYQFYGASFEAAVALDQAGKSAQAVKAYQAYLSHHSSTPQAALIYYRIAKNYEAQSDNANALKWYDKIMKDYPRSEQASYALLDITAIYRDKLKDPAKAMEYGQQAFTRYMDNNQLRDAVQALIEKQYQAALASFAQKEYKKTVDIAGNIFQAYPASLFVADTRSKIEALIDRARRAGAISDASVDQIVLRDEIPFDKAYEADFASLNIDEKMIPSPDGKRLVRRMRDSDGNYYLSVAKVPLKGKKASFKRLSETTGAGRPDWSPDGQELVFFRKVKKSRELVKVDLKTMTAQSLFSTNSPSLGLHPVFHPAGNKIAYIYEDRVGLINSGNKVAIRYEGPVRTTDEGAYFKQLLKTKQKLNYTADLTWSTDGTMIRCHQADKKGKPSEELLVLDVSASNNP
jgi:tetratricopeptide (TPR) repeat protein